MLELDLVAIPAGHAFLESVLLRSEVTRWTAVPIPLVSAEVRFSQGRIGEAPYRLVLLAGNVDAAND